VSASFFAKEMAYFCRMDHYIETLGNGLRTVFKPTASPVVHVGLIIGAGSRDEKNHEHGLAHFIEHTVFKGTTHRKSYHILSYIDSVGGEINAFTSREETCLYASIPANHAERAMELLSDVFFNCNFPEKEVKKEKEVVMEEIKYYRDLPDEMILDEFEELLYPTHPLGRSILGKASCIKSFNPALIREFITRNYTADRTVLSVSGGIDIKTWKRLSERYFGHEKIGQHAELRMSPAIGKQFIITKNKKIHQTHCILGGRAYSFSDEKRAGLVFLNNLLGGPGNNSRLNMEVRERHALVYTIESNYNPYSDGGTFLIYFGCDRKQLDKAFELIRKELRILCEKPMGELSLQRAKKQISGQLILANESRLSDMLSMGKSLLIRDSVYTLEDAVRDIESLKPDTLLEIAREILDPEKLSQLVYTPR
jgi:predicted Zn-dependent peptidase